MKKILTILLCYVVSTKCLAISLNIDGYGHSSYSSNNNSSYYERMAFSNRHSLQGQLNMAEDEIYELKKEIKELEYEIDNKDDELYSLHSWNVGLWIAVSVLLIIIVVQIIFYRHKSFNPRAEAE